MPSRACNTCSKEFPRTLEFWYKERKSRDGLGGVCKECTRQRSRNWLASNRERARAQHREHWQQNRPALLAKKRLYTAANRQEIRSRDKEWRAANVKTIVAKVAEWRRDNPERYAAQRKEYLKRTAARINQLAKAWRDANPESAKAISERRRAAVKGAPGDFTKDDLLRQLEKQQGLCFYCHKDLAAKPTVDHYIPLSKGGTHYPDNIVLACWPCNASKHDTLPADFLLKLNKRGA